jgi:hypothetical protein
MRKEVEIGGKWYWELEATDQNQAFNPPEPALLWDDGTQDVADIYFVTKKGESSHPFKTGRSVSYKHCALLSSEHEKKSRRCTAKELSKWVLEGNGFWLDRDEIAKTLGDFLYTKKNDECGKIVISICTWDGEPMEPTAQNMGLPE